MRLNRYLRVHWYLRVRLSQIHAYMHTYIHTCIHTYIRTRKHTNIREANALDSNSMCACTGGRRPIGYLIFIGHFPHKSPILRGSFALLQKFTCNLRLPLVLRHERWGAGVETQKNVRGEIGGWGRVPFNETYAPSLSTIYDGA